MTKAAKCIHQFKNDKWAVAFLQETKHSEESARIWQADIKALGLGCCSVPGIQKIVNPEG
jgi:hypothetical protein